MKKHAVLINNAHVENFSVRSLAAYLKSKGFRVSTLHYESRKEEVFHPVSPKALELLADFCQDADLIGISMLTTHLLTRSVQMTQFLRERLDTPVIWGGPPIIAEPGYHLGFTDLICAGEGENVMKQLLEGAPWEAIPGLGYRDETGTPVINPLPRMLDLNRLPLPCLDLEDGYRLTDTSLVPLKDDLPQSLSTYSVLLVRGCPYRCAYCLNTRLRQVFKGKGKYVRFQEIDRAITELEWAKQHIPRLKRIIIDDDDFFLNSEDRMKAFLDQYMAKINLPVFYLQANTRQITKQKLDILARSGLSLRYMKIGLQSASTPISRDIFNRPFNRTDYLEKVKIVLSAGFRIMVDIISDNPYETARDKHEALQFYLDLLEIAKTHTTIEQPIKMYDHKLMYYPGSPLYERALNDRYIHPNYVDQVLLKRSTLRSHREDLDLDALLISLFNRAVNKKGWHRAARALLRLIKVKPVYYAVSRLDIARYFQT